MVARQGAGVLGPIHRHPPGSQFVQGIFPAARHSVNFARAIVINCRLSRSESRGRIARKLRKKVPVPQAERASKSRWWWLEPLGCAFLGILTIFFLATSWRKWPDALIDFGRELYIPWRLTQGSLLYRDLDDSYGPLSQYLNAELFRVFGSSMMVLVAANIAVFAGILTAVYLLFRRAWGKFPAFLSSAIFIAVFGFGQYVQVGNYNYATPYSHEASHGMLVCLLLVLALICWVQRPNLLRGSLAGVLLGLTAVLKPEFLLAGGLITLVAFGMRWRHKGPVPLAPIGFWAAATVAPTLGFAVYFSAFLPWKEAFANASRGWLNATGGTRFTSDPIQLQFLGLDQPGKNLVDHAAATLFAAVLIAAILGAAWLADRRSRSWERVLLSSAVIGAVGWLSISRVQWALAGRCLLGLAFAYIFISGWAAVQRSASEPEVQVSTLRLMIGLLAAALMARMFLNGRIFHYGFYQAALAAVLAPAVITGELPARFGFKSWGKTIVMVGALALFVPGIMALAGQSQRFLRMKTLSIGRDGDQFYSFPQEVEPTGELVRLVTEWLEQYPAPETLIVLPEGEMINYLLRKPSPVPPFIFYSAAITGGRGEQLMKDLRQHPPAWVVMITRDLREYGIERYGEAPGKGQEILRWVSDNYELAVSIGGNPLDIGTPGAMVLRRMEKP